MINKINKRRNIRQRLTHATINVACGSRVINNGEICDVSTGGLSINNVPVRILGNKLDKLQRLTAVIEFRGKHIRVGISPRWLNAIENSTFASIGFEVTENYDTWYNFIRTSTDLAPKRREDIWGLQGQKYVRDSVGG